MTPERRALCPECQRLAVDEVIYPARDGTTVREGSYLCPVGHQFLMRWNTEQPDQKEVGPDGNYEADPIRDSATG